eukprot:COSAG02_NODE_1228_length_13776_cov_5.546864_5_plen_146_part_00
MAALKLGKPVHRKRRRSTWFCSPLSVRRQPSQTAHSVRLLPPPCFYGAAGAAASQVGAFLGDTVYQKKADYFYRTHLTAFGARTWVSRTGHTYAPSILPHPAAVTGKSYTRPGIRPRITRVMPSIIRAIWSPTCTGSLKAMREYQ